MTLAGLETATVSSLLLLLSDLTRTQNEYALDYSREEPTDQAIFWDSIDKVLPLISAQPSSIPLWHEAARAELRANRLASAANAFRTTTRILSSLDAKEPAMPTDGVRGVVVYLSSNCSEDVRLLMHSLHLLHVNFLSRFPYPVIVFHDGLSQLQRTMIRSVSSASVGFEYVNLRDLPACLNTNKLQQRIDNERAQRSADWDDWRDKTDMGYRYMIRWCAL